MHPISPPHDRMAQVTQALIRARTVGQPVDAATMQLDDATQAYGVQAAVAQAHGWPTPARHWKSGGPGRNATLTHAPLPPAGVWPSPADARGWPFHLRGIEAEIALRLGQAVDGARAASLDMLGAISLVDAMTVSIEVVDSRWQQALEAPALHKLADLQSHGALVLGDWVPWRELNWETQRCTVHVGPDSHEFQGSHAMRHPAFVLPAWLRHATRDGAVLPAGTVVTTGTWCGILPARPGDEIVVRFPGIGESRVTL